LLLLSPHELPSLPDKEDVVLTRVDLGRSAFPDAIRVAHERMETLLAMATFGRRVPWERIPGFIHIMDGHIVSHWYFEYEKHPMTFRYAADSTAAQIAHIAPKVAPLLPVQDPGMKDIVDALPWWRVGLDHPTAAAIVLNVRVLELVASRIGEPSWTTYMEKYVKHMWVSHAMMETLRVALWEALRFRPLSPEAEARQREMFLEATSYQKGQQEFNVQTSARHLDEIIGFIPAELPLGRDLRSIKQRTSSADAMCAWRADLERSWAGWVHRLERVRNAITHGGPFTERAVLLAQPFSQQVSVWALWECVEGFLDGKTLAQTHDELATRGDQWRSKIQSATSIADVFWD
jgi:hypothetical protein